MQHFEAKLSRAAAPAIRDILGAIAVVVNSEGRALATLERDPNHD